jgi:hypothetical protein
MIRTAIYASSISSDLLHHGGWHQLGLDFRQSLPAAFLLICFTMPGNSEILMLPLAVSSLMILVANKLVCSTVELSMSIKENTAALWEVEVNSVMSSFLDFESHCSRKLSRIWSPVSWISLEVHPRDWIAKLVRLLGVYFSEVKRPFSVRCW